MDSESSQVDNELSASLDAIRHMDSSPEESTSEDTTKSSSDDCCWTKLKGCMRRQDPKDVYQMSDITPQSPEKSPMPEIRLTAPTPPPELDCPEVSRLTEIRRRQDRLDRVTMLFHERSLDPLPRSSYITISRYSVRLRGFPMTEPEVTYAWLIDFCSKFEGYRALYQAPTYHDEVYIEFCGSKEARYAAWMLHGRRISETHFLDALVTLLPFHSLRVDQKETLV